MITFLGVLVHNNAVIPGSDDAIKKLRSLGKNIGFVTNNSLYSFDNVVKLLTPFGGKTNEIFTPNLALVRYLKNINFQQDIYVVCPRALKSVLTDAGYNIIEYKVSI